MPLSDKIEFTFMIDSSLNLQGIL